MSVATVWRLGSVPLRNSLRAVVYTRRGPDAPRRVPPLRFLVKAALLVSVCFVAPVVFSPAVAAAIRRHGAPLEAFAALGWTIVSGLSLAFGVVAALGTTLPRALLVDELLLSLPIPRRTYVGAKLLALELEGAFWTLLLAYPFLLQFFAMRAAGPAVHGAALAAGLIQSVAMTSLGIGLAHGFLTLRPNARRLRLLVHTMMVLVVGGGLGIIGVMAQRLRGGALAFAQALADVPASPTALPQRISLALQSGAFGSAAAGLGLLAVEAGLLAAGALVLMAASHSRICFVENQ